MAVALECHHLVDLLGPEGDHPPHVVAGEVQEHQVLGSFLGILDQFGSHPALLGVGATPAPGAGDGTGDDPALEELDHRLR